MDIVEIEGKPIAKRGKMSGAKRVLRCDACFHDKIVPLQQNTDWRCECGGHFVDLLVPWFDNGTFHFSGSSPQETRKYVLEQMKAFEL